MRRTLSHEQKREKEDIARAYRLNNQTENVPWTVRNALLKGNWASKISFLIMGFGNLIYGQVIKGFLWLLTQALYIYFMITSGLENLSLFGSLGWLEQQEVWNPEKAIYEYQAGHNSVLILLWGVITICITVAFIFIWRSSVRSSYKAEFIKNEGFEPASFSSDVKSLFNHRIQGLLLSLPVLGTLTFSVLPLIFMISMAFTSYSRETNSLVLFDWTGFDNFSRVLQLNNAIGKTFWPVVGWTIIWAVFATALNFIFGLLLAMMINRKRTRLKSVWRVSFAATIAVPQFVSLLVIRQMLAANGPINLFLIAQNVIKDPIPFWTDPTLAKIMVIVINLWVGIPYTILQVTGILQNFPEEFREAARIDGASEAQTFRHITLPYILQIMGPFLITQFTGNVNNFNVIYLLTGGGPARFGSTAGYTDLLVTWLYKLTVDNQFYNIGSVIGIFTFIVLSVVALTLYRFTSASKREGGK
ncbi:carbohydrate ABC transporter permease [Fastidiosipila sanguinis]|uniref:Maltose/maltodextrin transport system permease protein n=1 Tax=Fastidiosipila sanguinis TaxID=236753 RepID=A0A2S0KNA3_9FIRM|nr:sugar ABC transporter permease [Fastidiosipila sanguinis]AVM42510.1 sugar ABC transporter permease [Fastidiosipila sanguinis]